MTKLSQEQIVELQVSNDSLKVLSLRFGVTVNTIRYHKDSEFKEFLRVYNRERYLSLSFEKKKEYQSKRKDYQRLYHKKRYQEDPEFRKKQVEYVKNYQKKKVVKQ